MPGEEGGVGAGGARMAPSRANAPAVAPVMLRRVVLLAPVAARVRRSLAVSLRIRPTVIPSTPRARRTPAAVDQFRNGAEEFCAFLVSTYRPTEAAAFWAVRIWAGVSGVGV